MLANDNKNLTQPCWLYQFSSTEKYILCLLLNKEQGFYSGYFLLFLGKEAVPNESILKCFTISRSLPENNEEQPMLNDQKKKTPKLCLWKLNVKFNLKCLQRYFLFVHYDRNDKWAKLLPGDNVLLKIFNFVLVLYKMSL